MSGLALESGGIGLPQKSRNLTQTYVTVPSEINDGASPADWTIYTVTSGNDFYVTAIVLHGGAAGAVMLRDGTSGTPTLKLETTVGASSLNPVCLTFPTPLVFTTGVFFKGSERAANGYWRITLVGYESQG